MFPLFVRYSSSFNSFARLLSFIFSGKKPIAISAFPAWHSVFINLIPFTFSSFSEIFWTSLSMMSALYSAGYSMDANSISVSSSNFMFLFMKLIKKNGIMHRKK